MASISNDPNGLRRIQFFDAKGNRKTIRLGKVPARYAESVKVKVEDLAYAATTGHAPKDETAHWLANLEPVLAEKIARVGLAPTRKVATLGSFTRTYIDGRADIQPRTRINLEQTRDYLLELFDADRPLREFTRGDGEDFRQHMVRSGRAENTARRAIGRARQLFEAARRHGLVSNNPFEGIAAKVHSNPSRFYFVGRDEVEAVLKNCPDAEWRLIFALCRYGGLRCPSEVLALRWGDVDIERGRIRVPSPKTEHLEGRDSRTIPLFPELRPHLLAVGVEGRSPDEFLINRYRGGNSNLRTQLSRIIRRAGMEPWPKLFQNLRSTRETELAETFPTHVVCRWIGNSEPVAAAHYLQLTDEHFERAIGLSNGRDEAAQNAAQKMHESSRNDSKQEIEESMELVGATSGCGNFQEDSDYFNLSKVPPRGVEPRSPD